jgi:hypothetical protein
MQARKQWTNIAQCYVNMVWTGKEMINADDIYDYLMREAGIEWSRYQSKSSLDPKVMRLVNYLAKVALKVYDRNKHLFVKGVHYFANEI